MFELNPDKSLKARLFSNDCYPIIKNEKRLSVHEIEQKKLSKRIYNNNLSREEMMLFNNYWKD